MPLVKVSNKSIGIAAFAEGGVIRELSVGGGGFADEYSEEDEGIYRQFRDYLDRKNFVFDLKLDLSILTPFQKIVFAELVKIPAGRTVTYRELASRVKGPGHARAVARAIAANPYPVVIPCHRVVGVNSLGGYSGGFEPVRDPVAGLIHKVRLLRHEGVNLPAFGAYPE